MVYRTSFRLVPLFLLGALLAAACTAPAGDFSAEAFESLPEGVEISYEDSSIEFTDVVQSIGSGEWVVGAFTLTISAETEIEPGIAEGDLVRVHAILTGEGNFVAREISFASNDEAAMPEDQDSSEEHEDGFFGDELEFIGIVEAMGETSWTVAGQTILVTPETEIKDFLATGDLVKVHAFLSETGELTAREIELTDESALDSDEGDSDDDLKFVGVVESIDGETWVIDGQTFQVDPAAEIDEGIMVGDTVEVYLFLTSDGLTIVREISLDDDFNAESDDLDDDEFEDEDEDDDLDDDDHSDASESDDSLDDDSSDHD
jgi:hypothetical protein